MKARLIGWFVLAELVVCALLFGSAMWGKQLLAPIDIAPAFFSKYRFVDPASSGVPGNHYMIDQLTYDLPLQMSVYQACRRGEIPWWDAYDAAGRPFLADPHVNGTDPLRRICYALLPFEAAYNWTLIGRSVLTGLAVFLLLRHFRFAGWQCVLLGVTYQFSTSLSMHFGHSWVGPSYIYYPLLWVVWDKWFSEPRWLWPGVAGILIALVLYSGSLQTHSYLAVFAAAFLFGYGALDKSLWKRALAGVLLSFCIGVCLAGPVILGQLELFLNSLRRIHTPFHPLGYFGGLASLTALYPWVLGTFRTIDLSKIADQPLHFGFALFIGSAAICLALFGAFAPSEAASRLRQQRRTALWLLVFYFLIVSTPVVTFTYLRISGLGALALTLLAGFGINALVESRDSYSSLGRWLAGLTVAVALVINVFALAVYPKLLPKVRERALVQKTRLPNLPKLREFQVNNLPAEISFANPETILASAGLLFLAVLLIKPSLRTRQPLWVVLLVLNGVPVLLYSYRYIPRQPIERWERLRTGGPEQQYIQTLLGDSSLRLSDVAPSMYDQLFPQAMSHLYRVRTVHGYTSLNLRTLEVFSEEELASVKPQVADFIYQSEANSVSGKLITNATPGLARFQWQKESERKFEVSEPGFNTIKLRFAAGKSGTLLWSDTYFPGWKAFIDGQEVRVHPHQPCFSAIDVPADSHELLLHYEPRPLHAGLGLAALGLMALVATFVPRRSRQREATAHKIAEPLEAP